MSSPFPGMDPYLEDPTLWPGFHHALAEEIKLQLNAQLGARYYADVAVRTVSETIRIGAPHVTYPDAGVYETPISNSQTASLLVPAITPYAPAPVQRTVLAAGQTRLRSVHVYTVGSDQLVTTVEILSPYNKRHGEGLREYQEKRMRLLDSTAHLIEVDLLRGGERPGSEVADPPLMADYILLVNRSRQDDLRVSEIWPLLLNEPLPILPVPLLAPDPDVQLDLQTAIQIIYPGGAYHKRIDYHAPVPPPALRPAMSAWLEQKFKLSL